MAKVMISLPDDLLAAIDAEARRRHVTRSGLLAQAAGREIARRAPDDVSEAIERSTARFAATRRFESGQLVRRMRDSAR